MVTEGWCPSGLATLRQSFPVPPKSVVQPDPDRKAYTATCHVCKRPNTPVVKKDGKPFYSPHKESVASLHDPGGLTSDH